MDRPMKLCIRIPLQVLQLNALSGYYTDGPTLTSLHGLVSQLETDAEFVAEGFGLVVETYEARLGESITTGFDATPREKQSMCFRPSTGYRYANMRAGLYLSTEALCSEDVQDLVGSLYRSINRCRFQGGILRPVMPDGAKDLQITIALVRDAIDLATFISQSEKAIASVYLSQHLPATLHGAALQEAFAQELTYEDRFMLCNGYVKVGTLPGQAAEHAMAEPSFTLARTIKPYQLAKMEPAEQTESLSRFFWSLDQAEYATNPNHFFII